MMTQPKENIAEREEAVKIGMRILKTEDLIGDNKLSEDYLIIENLRVEVKS